ncbi:ChaN family lipoprotein [Oleidesulfovibrio sp.]|uniref:ChaN family lipoprotein n=1 Tax=Oleidesulfovibrio sp. TaxID=2909707 RepID=UPI003A890F53
MGLALRLAVLSILILMAGGCATVQPPPSPVPVTPPEREGTLFMPDGSEASYLAFGQAARSHDYILLGEGHTSPCDHAVQARLLQVMVNMGMRPAVGLEMVPKDRQPVLDRFNKYEALFHFGDADELLTPENFAEAVDWKNVWGYPYSLYKPVFETAYRAGLPMYALNVPSEVVRKVGRQGVDSLDESERRWLPETIIPPSQEQRDMLELMFKQHDAMRKSTANATRAAKKIDAQEAESPADAKRGSMDRFFLVQSIWDTAMAQNAVDARKKHGGRVAVIVGSGHVEHGWGLAYRLGKLDPDAKVLLVMPWRATASIDPAEGDFFFYCPASHKSRLGFTLEMKGDKALVTDVEPDSAAGASGFKAGDVIESVDGDAVNSLWTLHKAGVRASREKRPMAFGVVRDGASMTIEVEPPSHGRKPATGTKP